MQGLTKIRVSHDDFDVSEEMAQLARSERTAGAVVTFTGIVRSDGAVTAMELEHYPGMTEKALASIVQKARARWTIEDVVIIHRVGRLEVGEQIVLTLVTSTHRREAFEASEFIMDWLKTQAPFWKKEYTPSGARWVDARESDDLAQARWGEEA
ncbi:MAG: molybdopterin synthase catalytic subunit MoaE [Duodenibacillus sp.]